MTQYKYDMRLGHYVPIYESSLLEGQVPGMQIEGEKQEKKEENQQQSDTKVIPNLETAEIIQMRKDMQTKLVNAQKEIQSKQDNINQIQMKIGNEVDSKKITDLQKTLIQAQMDLTVKKFDYYKLEADEMKKILAEQKKLLESQNINARKLLPSKYRFLLNKNNTINESNIQNAKIYVDKLIKDDGMERIKGMVDFKKAFKDSDLLYGKDKEGGYFAVCVDQEDFNKLADTLEEAGYLRDDILAVTLPQVFDRSNLTK